MKIFLGLFSQRLGNFLARRPSWDVQKTWREYDFHLILTTEPERSSFMSGEWENQLHFVQDFFAILPPNKSASLHLHPRDSTTGETAEWVKQNPRENVHAFIGSEATDFNQLVGMSSSVIVEKP